MKPTNRDYTKMNEFMKSIGFQGIDGEYFIRGFAYVDLTACTDDEHSIIRTILQQNMERSRGDGRVSLQRELKDLLDIPIYRGSEYSSQLMKDNLNLG